MVAVVYTFQDGTAAQKQLPANHGHLRLRPSPEAPSVSSAPLSVHQPLGGKFTPGEEIEVWSESQQSWLPGDIVALKGDVITVEYAYRNGPTMRKDLPASQHGLIRSRHKRTHPRHQTCEAPDFSSVSPQSN